MLERAIYDRFAVDLGPAAVALGLGWLLLLLRSPARRHALPTLAALAGLLPLGLSVHSLRPYHLRILAAPLAVGAGLGLARLWLLPVPLLFAGWLARSPLAGSPDRALAMHDEIARRLGPIAAPIRVDGAWFDGPLCLEPSVLLLVSDPGLAPPADALWARPGCAAIPFADLAADGAWVADQTGAPPRLGGAWDWWAALHPEGADLGDTAW